MTRVPGRTRAGFAFAFVLAAAPFQDAKPFRFDPSRDLEGFEACYSSEFNDLYPLDEYSALLGKEMKPAELADVQKRWRAAVTKSDGDLAGLRADPKEECAWLLRRRMSKSTFFSKITCVEDRSVPGFVFFVQRPAKDVEGYAARTVGFYGPWVAKLRSVFDANLAEPLSLERARDRVLTGVVILASEGDYRNFWRIHTNPCAVAPWACYDPPLHLVVGYDDPFRPSAALVEQRYPILDALVFELLSAVSTSPLRRPLAVWIDEGVASFFASHDGTAPDCLDQRPIHPSTLQTVVGLAANKDTGPLVLHPLEELVALKSREDVDALVTARAEAAGVKRPPQRDVENGFLGESYLWVQFFFRARDGALWPSFREYLRLALSVDGSPGAMRLALKTQDLVALDREFLAWLVAENARAFPQSKVDPARILAVFDARRGASGPVVSPAPGQTAPGQLAAGQPAAGQPAPGSPAQPPFSPASLAIEAGDVESRHGLALLAARDGDLEGALEALRAIAASRPVPHEEARVQRDLMRVGELVKLRDGFLENLRQSGAKWSTEYQGKKLIAAVSKVGGGLVHLAENRQGVATIPLAALDPMEIAKQATKKEQQGNSAPWARFYAYVLAEDAKWEKLLKDPSEEARALREDAQTWLPARLRAGTTARALDDLAKTSLPKTPNEGAALCEAIRALIAAHGTEPAVVAKNAGLKRFAAAGADAALAESEPAAFLHGKCTPLGDGRVSIVYEFDDPAEAADFKKDVGYMKGWRKGFKVDAGTEDESNWTVESSRFEGIGAACYRYAAAFQAPITVRYGFQVFEPDNDAARQGHFVVGICDDRKENCVQALDFGHLAVRDSGKGVHTRVNREGDSSYFLATPYELELRHDGAKASVWVDGEKTAEAACETRKSGDVFLWFHTTLTIAVERFEIEGKLDPASVKALRAAAAEKKVAEIGFR